MEFCQSKNVETLVIIQIQNVIIIRDNKNNQGGHSTGKTEFGSYSFSSQGNAGNFAVTLGKIWRHRENICL